MSTSPDHHSVNNHAKIITIPNILSISRLLFLPLILFFLLQHESILAIITMLVSWSTDALDGFLARRLNQVSDTGKVLDHLVDKIWIAAVLVTLVYLSDLPFYLAVSVIIRDLLILTGSFILMKFRGKLVSSDAVGKLTGLAFALLILYYTLSINNRLAGVYSFISALGKYKYLVNVTVLVLIIISFLNYLVLFLRIMLKLRFPGD
ncbi:MAG: CDP-alcohol phosphatidyltransferase family protein [candidate division WOR-3 bacterium]|mgnify:CR=1 FL=1|uniref:CDP-alcohol phosphatidyltransferase family protein n=1 Tax=candidate division WOR-3 bacterium TaxID=2052148 RepID=A0A7C1NE89_UNCW3|nr:CDP-alcohol phosphatidyltransferase family protein [candidate division WOR-3 bacterium]